MIKISWSNPQSKPCLTTLKPHKITVTPLYLLSTTCCLSSSPPHFTPPPPLVHNNTTLMSTTHCPLPPLVHPLTSPLNPPPTRAQQHHANVYYTLPKSDMQDESEPALSKMDVILNFSLEVSFLI